MYSMTQMIEITIIILPLFLSLLKIRQFRTEHNKEVRTTKLRVHFAIAVLLQLLFIFDFILQWRLACVFWIDNSGMTLEEAQAALKACLFWQVVL